MTTVTVLRGEYVTAVLHSNLDRDAALESARMQYPGRKYTLHVEPTHAEQLEADVKAAADRRCGVI